MRGVRRSEPKPPAVFPSVHARRYSVRTGIRGDIFEFKCEALLGQNENSWRYFPVLMRCVCRSEPKALAVFASLNAGRLSVGAKIPGGISRFKCEAFVGREQNTWRLSSV